MNFKFFKGMEYEMTLVQDTPGDFYYVDNTPNLLIESTIQNNILTFNTPTFERNNVEFCFQFNDDEPVVFANGPSDLTLTITPTPYGNISFNNNGNVFTILARERQ